MAEQEVKQCTVHIDGKSYQAKHGQTIIQVADSVGAYIPRFCYHEKLSVVANCRMCLVEVGNVPKALPACATPISDGMEVMTQSPKALAAQRSVMEFLLINHPLDCPVCDQGGACELQDLSMGFGRGKSEFGLRKRSVVDLDIGPLIKTHMTRCIHCTRCVRFGEEVAGMRELGATGRGEDMEIGTYVAKMVDSELSGNVIDICPVGALTSKPFAFQARHWELRQHPSIASHDALGSKVYLHSRGDQYHAGRTVMKVIPRHDQQLNENWLSDRDRYSYLGINSTDRLKTPEIKVNGHWQAVSWTEALDVVVQTLAKAAADETEGSSIAGLASARCTTESLYYFQTLLRGLGSSHIDFRTHQTDFSDDPVLPVRPHAIDSLAELETSDAVLLLGCSLRHEQPMINHRVRKAVLRGATAVAMNAVGYDANHHMAHDVIIPMAQWVPALAHCITKVMGAKCPEPIKDYADQLTLEAKTLQPITSLLKSAKQPIVMLGADADSHPQSAILRQLCYTLTHHLSTAFVSLPLGPNVAGGYAAGAIPHRDMMGQRLSRSGDHARAMMERNKEVYVLMNVEPEWDCADAVSAARALAAAKFVVNLTPYATDAMRETADVLLPIAPYGHESGSFINALGQWQVMTALPMASDDIPESWSLIKKIADRLAIPGFEQHTPADIRASLKNQLSEVMAASEQEWRWPVLQQSEASEADHLTCFVRTHMYQIDSLVRRSSALQAAAATAVSHLHLNSQDMQRLGLSAGDQVTISVGDQRSWQMPCAVNDLVPMGTVMLYRRPGEQMSVQQGQKITVNKGLM